MRWEEEVGLLLEEMRRVKAFLTWQAEWWVTQACRRGLGTSLPLIEGLTAYARRQAHIRLELKAHFENMWRFVNQWVSMEDIPGDEDEEDVPVEEEPTGIPETFPGL